jgi:hypothetical protein
VGCAALLLSLGAHADTFAKAYYDSRTDQLVVGMIYGGTNSQHAFTLQWGQCQDVSGSNWHDVAAEILDSQWQDQAVPLREDGAFQSGGHSLSACARDAADRTTVHFHRADSRSETALARGAIRRHS